MKVISRLSILFAAATFLHGGEVREFTSTGGQSFSGEFISTDGTNATIKRSADGRTFTIPLNRLSPSDRLWIKQQSAPAVSEGGSSEPQGGKSADEAASPAFEIPSSLPDDLYPRSLNQIQKSIAEIRSRGASDGVSAKEHQALTELNIFRYLAGVPHDVTIDAEKTSQAQEAAAALEKAGQFSREIGSFTDKVSQYGASDMVKMVPALIYDDSTANRETRGNRANLLEPGLETTGFAEGGEKFATALTLEVGRGKAKDDITFPARGLHPSAYFDSAAWTYYRKRGDAPEADTLEVIVRQLDEIPTKEIPWDEDVPGRPVKDAPQKMPIFTHKNRIIFEPSIDALSEPGIYWVRIQGRGFKAQYPVVLF